MLGSNPNIDWEVFVHAEATSLKNCLKKQVAVEFFEWCEESDRQAVLIEEQCWELEGYGANHGMWNQWETGKFQRKAERDRTRDAKLEDLGLVARISWEWWTCHPAGGTSRLRQSLEIGLSHGNRGVYGPTA